jgi:multidrug efflux system outer membrane protein
VRAQAARADSAAATPELERLIVLKENQIAILLGRPPATVARGAALDRQTMPPATTPGLPAALLERRPDVRQAEQAVVAANAAVGVTVANFFPRIGLTSFYGEQSDEIENLVRAAAAASGRSPASGAPALPGRAAARRASRRTRRLGRSGRAVNARPSRRSARSLTRSPLQQKLTAVRAASERQVASLQVAVHLAQTRYDSGLAYYFEVIDAQQQLFPAELLLARTRRDQLVATVVLYRALGGGWQVADDDWMRPTPMPATPASDG